MKAITDVLVVGDDCDGLFAAINLKVVVPQVNVQVVRHALQNDFSLEGWATTPLFLEFLHAELGIRPLEFLRAVRPAWRLGTRYHWGPREFFDHTCDFQLDTKYAMLSRESGFYVGDSARAFEWVGLASALMSRGCIFPRGKDGQPKINLARVGYHIEHDSLRRYLQTLALRVGVIFRDGEVTEVVRGEGGIACIELDGGELLTADLYLDATGSQSLLLGRTLNEPFQPFPELLCDKALIASWPRQDDAVQPHSTVHTMEAGWAWRTEHERFIACGHAFSSRHISAQQAEAQLRQLYPDCGPVRVLSMVQGRRENAWVGNVIGLGNASALIEPLAAAGPATLAFQCQYLARTLSDCDRQLRPTLSKQFNKRWRRLVDSERDFLSLFYRYNTRLNTPFWQEARQSARHGELEPVLQCYLDIGPDSLYRNLLLYEQDPIGLEGYLSVLVGQCVPWNHPWRPEPNELANWAAVLDSWQRTSANAFTITQARNLLLGEPRTQAPIQQRFMHVVA